MRARLLKIPMPLVNSFSIRRDTLPYINNYWHYHREIELVYIKNGSGTQFIGDHVKPFTTGQAVLIGGHLPHYWKFDDVYFSSAHEAPVDVIVIHFNNDFFGESFLNLPENKIIRKVLRESGKGIQIDNSYGQQIGELMENIFLSVGTKRLLLLLEILTIMGSELKNVTLLSPDFKNNAWVKDNSPISNIYNFILANFNQKINTQQLADLADTRVVAAGREPARAGGGLPVE